MAIQTHGARHMPRHGGKTKCLNFHQAVQGVSSIPSTFRHPAPTTKENKNSIVPKPQCVWLQGLSAVFLPKSNIYGQHVLLSMRPRPHNQAPIYALIKILSLNLVCMHCYKLAREAACIQYPATALQHSSKSSCSFPC